MDTPGRFGTIELLRAIPNSNAADLVIASFGVDTTSVSFGRDPTCGVRLYYPTVAPLHARIVFNEDRKAFVEVLGSGGVVVDGCMVFPNESSGTKTIPLANASELEINGKRFRFTYPPKEMRAALAASPARPGNRALRLSMIASAQVFSPRPSHDPRENLRVLQSPLRLSSPRKTSAPGTPSPSPRNQPTTAQLDAEEDDTITLVQGSHPRVVEEAKDLVILEDVELTAEERANAYTPPGSPSPNGRARSGSVSAGVPGIRVSPGTTPPAAPSAPKTPRRQSLHKLVLLRSAQRAVWNANSNSGSSTPTSSNSSNSNSTSSTPSAGDHSVLRGWQSQSQPQPLSPKKRNGMTLTPVTQSPFGHYQDSEKDSESAKRFSSTTRQEDSESDTDTEEEEAEVQRLGLEIVSVSSGSDVSDEEDANEEDGEEEQEQKSQPRLGWRKSLERIALWPFGGGRVKEEEEDVALPSPTNDHDEDRNESDDEHEENEGNDDDNAELEAEIVTPTRKLVGAQRTPAATRTPIATRPASPAKLPARSRSPVKTATEKPDSVSRFGAPHPAAQTPRGFGRKSLPATEPKAQDEPQETVEVANDGVAPMDVDEEGYKPVYEDLSAYRVAQPTVSESSPRRTASTMPSEDKAKTPSPTKAVRPLAAFMTPQAPRSGGVAANGVGGGAAVPRYSLGGAARRVLVEDSPWKVRDLLATTEPSGRAVTPAAGNTAGMPATPSRRPPLSEAERRAISERRRSALTAPDDYFKGAIPGMSPAKKGATQNVLRRVSEDGSVGDGDAKELSQDGEEKKDEDPRRMLESLKVTVEGLKRRRESVLADAGRSPPLAEDDDEVRVEFQPVVVNEESQQEKAGKEVQMVKSPGRPLLRGRQKEPASQSETEQRETEPQAKKETKPKSARGKSQEPQEAMELDVPVKPTRRTRKATPTPAPEASDEEMAADPAPAPAPPKSSRRGRKPAVVHEPEPEPTEMAEPEPAPTKPARRTRAATAEPESDADQVVVTPAPTKARRTRKATAEPESGKEADPPVPVRRAPRKPPSVDASGSAPTDPATEPVKRRGRPAKAAVPASVPERKTTRGRSRAPEESADDTDPLDSITETPEIELVAVTAPKKRARSVKPKVVKDEEVEPILEEQPPRAGRAKKAPAAAPAAPKPRSTRKTAVPASAPAGVESTEKENTPGEDSDEPIAKVRVSRSKKAVKEETVETETAPRRTRTRTRT
ncbi:FHA domain-containing protein [Favolaschia claudopus]|uniref:FHA domain-containing protein n=1 Tax=Favolaschia claudopus TaxID=2862362 RepID=A0AAW0DAC9_9AGAR